MARIPEHIVEQIKDANDIVDVISSYITLKRKGANYWARCPFHGEKTASFSVSQPKQIYHCFGCGVGGNVLNFVMAYEKLSFPEALKILADRANISLEEYTWQPSEEEKSKTGSLYDIHRKAIDIYASALKTAKGKAAREYFIRREIRDETILKFELGYAPDSWDFLLKKLTADHSDIRLIEESGLITINEKGKRFDRFRDRIMFPIYNTRGNPVGFGGRIMQGDEKGAKYLNSPETPVYHKSSVLYGLHQTRDSIRKADEVLIVEGYMDLLQMWQYGFTNVIAGSGTAFTENHARIIRRYAASAILCYDGDSAGRKAALRTGLMLEPRGISCRIPEFPDGEDPDSYLRQYGEKAFAEILGKSRPLLGFIENWIHPLKLPAARRTEAVRKILEQLGPFSDSIREEMFLHDLAKVFGTDASILIKEQRKMSRGMQRESITAADSSDPDKKRFANRSEAAQYELLRLLLIHPDGDVRRTSIEILSDAFFSHDLLKRSAVHILKCLQDEPSTSGQDIAESAPDGQVKRLIYRMLMENPEYTAPRRAFLDCLISIEGQFIRDRIEKINEGLRESDKQGKLPVKLLKEKQKLTQELRDLPKIYTPELFH